MEGGSGESKRKSHTFDSSKRLKFEMNLRWSKPIKKMLANSNDKIAPEDLENQIITKLQASIEKELRKWTKENLAECDFVDLVDGYYVFKQS